MADSLTVAEALERAADLIEPEGKWTQGRPARGKDGAFVDARSPQAVCWCAIGAVDAAVASATFYFTALKARDALRFAIGSGFIVDWNDAPERTQTEVVAKLREAAALARAEGK